jgi:hypothetical protein
MAKVPEPLHSTAALIYQAYENDADSGNRPHLGASLIGHACERYLWMTFRWVESKKFDGRMLRLFETGQLEEARFVKNLRRIGIEVHDVDPAGGQWRVSDLGGHFGGSMDGAARGFPEAPKTWHVVEFKTHNDKSFKELLNKGSVRFAKPQHYAQMQVYMGLTGMDRAFYMAVNKNDDTLYTERVEFDPVEFVRLKARAERVINAAEPPLKISNDPSWWQCKTCDFHEHCHGTAAPQVNCRTCAHSTPKMDGDARWDCDINEADPSLSYQRQGCVNHRYIPILLQNFATQTDYVNGDVMYTDCDGIVFGNGENPGSLTSHDIRNLKAKSLAGGMAELKKNIDEAFGPGSKVIA